MNWTQNKIFQAIAVFHGDNFTGLDDSLPSPVDFATYAASVDSQGENIPATEEELEEAFFVSEGLQIDVKERKTKRQQLRSDWLAVAAQYPWITGPMESKFNAANELLNQSRDAEAVALIEYAEPSSLYSAGQVTVFNSVKAQFVAALNNLISAP